MLKRLLAASALALAALTFSAAETPSAALPRLAAPAATDAVTDCALARTSWLLAFPWPLPVPPARLHRRPGLCLCRGVRLASPSRCRHGKPVLVASLPLVPWLVKHSPSRFPWRLG
jgi:hypothetical protein